MDSSSLIDLFFGGMDKLGPGDHRSTFQVLRLLPARLSWFIPSPVAIGIVSLLFGAGHRAPGDSAAVMMDILCVIVDSVFYGIIFARSKNTYVAWLAHFLADVFGPGFVLWL